MSRVFTLVAVFLACVAASAGAQVAPCGPNDVVPWWPRAMFTDGSTLNAAERAEVEVRLGAVEAVMKKTSYATPRGFAVRTGFSYHEMKNRTELYPYGFSLGAYEDCSKYDEGVTHFSLDFNPDPMTWSEGDRPLLDENGDGLYLERARTPSLFSATVTFGRFQEEDTEGLFLLFTRNDQSPTLPVTREQYLRAMIFTLEGKDQEKVKAALAVASKTPYDRWMEDAPARKKRNEDLFAGIAQVAPAQALKTRADMEKAEAEETERLRKADAFERAQLGKNMAAVTALGDKYRAQIAAMAPAERALPAFLDGNDLAAADTPNAHALVRRNPAFYRATSSPLEPRAILVRIPGAHRALLQAQALAYRQINWAAIKKLVN